MLTICHTGLDLLYSNALSTCSGNFCATASVMPINGVVVSRIIRPLSECLSGLPMLKSMLLLLLLLLLQVQLLMMPMMMS